MGLICSVALMGDPSGKIGQGTSAKLAFTRLQEMIAGEDNYKVTESQQKDDDGPFSVYIADNKDLDKIYTGDVKLVSLVTAAAVSSFYAPHQGTVTTLYGLYQKQTYVA